MWRFTYFCLALALCAQVSLSQYEVCGDAPLNNRIVGGLDAIDGAWPWQVSLQSLVFGGHFCAGSLINHQWVMTAAHCLPNQITTANLVVYLGKMNLYAIDTYETKRNVIDIVIHPSYNSQTKDNDIALLQLDSPVVFSEHINSVCLAEEHTYLPAGTSSWVTGWGDIKDGGPLGGNGPLQELNVPIVSPNDCENIIGRPITNNMICAGDNQGEGLCTGDDGNPLVSYQCGLWIQTGISSWNYECGAPMPDVYTNVAEYRLWILDIITTDVPGFFTFSPGITCIGTTAAPIVTKPPTYTTTPTYPKPPVYVLPPAFFVPSIYKPPSYLSFSCKGRCGEAYSARNRCNCNKNCYIRCCWDYMKCKRWKW